MLSFGGLTCSSHFLDSGGCHLFNVDSLLEFFHGLGRDICAKELLKLLNFTIKIRFHVFEPHDVQVGVIPFGPSLLEEIQM